MPKVDWTLSLYHDESGDNDQILIGNGREYRPIKEKSLAEDCELFREKGGVEEWALLHSLATEWAKIECLDGCRPTVMVDVTSSVDITPALLEYLRS